MDAGKANIMKAEALGCENKVNATANEKSQRISQHAL